MSYGRMTMKDKRLNESIKEWFEKAEAADREDDELYGEGKRGDELPSWVEPAASSPNFSRSGP